LGYLQRALVAAPPPVIRDGGVIADGFDSELDELRSISRDAGGYLAQLEERERQRTGIANLKVGFNRVHGYYIEVGRQHADVVPPDWHRRQTLKSVERYVSEELRELYDAVLERILEDLAPLQRCAAALAEVDVLAAFAERAETLNLAAPRFADAPGIRIRGGRHPVVEQVRSEPFIPNDLDLDDERRMLIITGPNMGGKSTYMRQTALIVFMAHLGSYVPAEEAVIGPIDRIFTRIGAA